MLTYCKSIPGRTLRTTSHVPHPYVGRHSIGRKVSTSVVAPTAGFILGLWPPSGRVTQAPNSENWIGNEVWKMFLIHQGRRSGMWASNERWRSISTSSLSFCCATFHILMSHQRGKTRSKGTSLARRKANTRVIWCSMLWTSPLMNHNCLRHQ